jgi:L-seryl-tRNA(Ser) seleniumtransferase
VVAGDSLVEAAAAPEERIPGALVAVFPHRLSVADLEKRLRAGKPPVVARIEGDSLLIDLRTVFPEEEAELAGALNQAAAGHSE